MSPAPEERPLDAGGLRVAIRVDASSAIGTGHVFRSMAIFAHWQEAGGSCFFICREAPGHLIDLLRARGFRVHAIADNADPLTDATAFRTAVAAEGGADIVWVDHYGLDATWETHARGEAAILCVVDDLADRAHDCDILVDSSHGVEEAGCYDPYLDGNAIRLIGQDYVPLRREFTQYPKPQRPPGAPVRRLLVTLGGNDPLDTSSLVLDALDHPDLHGLAVDLTVGAANPRASALQERARAMPGVTAYFQHEHVADLMAAADLCIGAGGTTAWERCYMALPTLGLILADNQVALMDRLARLGVARNLGWADRLTPERLRADLLNAIEDRDWRDRTSQASSALVDGKGVARILAALCDKATTRPTSLRSA